MTASIFIHPNVSGTSKDAGWSTSSLTFTYPIRASAFSFNINRSPINEADLDGIVGTIRGGSPKISGSVTTSMRMSELSALWKSLFGNTTYTVGKSSQTFTMYVISNTFIGRLEGVVVNSAKITIKPNALVSVKFEWTAYKVWNKTYTTFPEFGIDEPVSSVYVMGEADIDYSVKSIEIDVKRKYADMWRDISAYSYGDSTVPDNVTFIEVGPVEIITNIQIDSNYVTNMNAAVFNSGYAIYSNAMSTMNLSLVLHGQSGVLGTLNITDGTIVSADINRSKVGQYDHTVTLNGGTLNFSTT